MDRMKNSVKKLMGRGLSFLLILVLLLLGVQAVLTPKWHFSAERFIEGDTDKYGSFYELPENTADYITIGASTSFYTVSSMQIYAKTGITGYCLGNGNQRTDLTYYVLKEGLKTQHPKAVFLDMAPIAISREPVDANITQVLTQMKPSLNKVEAAIDCQTESLTAAELLFPLLQFHNRWYQLNTSDFSFGPVADYAQNGSFVRFDVKMDTNVVDRPYGNIYALEDGMLTAEKDLEEINERYAEYFEKILALCQEQGIELIPTLFGAVYKSGRDRIIETYLEPFGLKLLNLNDPEVGIDWKQDALQDGMHTNYWGSAKASDYLADMLRAKGFEDHRGQSGYELWDQTLETYRQWEQGKLVSYEVKSAYEYLNALAAVKDEYLIALTVKDEASLAWNDTLEAALRRLGVKSSFYGQAQNSFVAILDRGENLFERWEGNKIKINTGFRTADGEEHSLYVLSAGFPYDNAFSVQIDGVDWSCGGRGLGIVVIDPDSGEVVSSVCIDSHVSKLTFTEKTLPEEQAEKWTQSTENFQLVEDGVYNILFAGGPAFAVDVPNGSTEENANIWLCERNGETPQEFEIRYIGDGLYTLRALCSDKYLAIENMGSTPNSNVVQETYTGLANQKWFITENLNGSYSFQSLYNGCMLDVVNGVAATGTNIQVCTENSLIPQQFFLEPVG